VFGSLRECLGVVGPESQGGQIPELTGPMQWPLGAPGKICRHLCKDIGGLVTTRGAPGNACDRPGSTSNHCRAVSDKRHILWERCRCAWKS